MGTDSVAKLKEQLQNLQPRWNQAFDSWAESNNVLRGTLENLERLLGSTPGATLAQLERERLRLEAVIRAVEKSEAVARINLAQIERLEQHAYEQLRWEGDQQLQRSTKSATWATAIVAAAALLLSAWNASRPSPVRLEIVQQPCRGAR